MRTIFSLHALHASLALEVIKFGIRKAINMFVLISGNPPISGYKIDEAQRNMTEINALNGGEPNTLAV